MERQKKALVEDYVSVALYIRLTIRAKLDQEVRYSLEVYLSTNVNYNLILWQAMIRNDPIGQRVARAKTESETHSHDSVRVNIIYDYIGYL